MSTRNVDGARALNFSDVVLSPVCDGPSSDDGMVPSSGDMVHSPRSTGGRIFL